MKPPTALTAAFASVSISIAAHAATVATGYADIHATIGTTCHGARIAAALTPDPAGSPLPSWPPTGKTEPGLDSATGLTLVACLGRSAVPPVTESAYALGITSRDLATAKSTQPEEPSSAPRSPELLANAAEFRVPSNIPEPHSWWLAAGLILVRGRRSRDVAQT